MVTMVCFPKDVTTKQLCVKVPLLIYHLSQAPWTLRTSWERLRSWRGCAMPSWSSCMLCAPWRSPSTSSQSWWRTAACWSTSTVRRPHFYLPTWSLAAANLWQDQIPVIVCKGQATAEILERHNHFRSHCIINQNCVSTCTLCQIMNSEGSPVAYNSISFSTKSIPGSRPMCRVACICLFTSSFMTMHNYTNPKNIHSNHCIVMHKHNTTLVV